MPFTSKADRERYQKERRQTLLGAGLCGKCGARPRMKKAGRTLTTCEECNAMFKAAMRRDYSKMVQRGMCVRCRVNPVASWLKTLCETCKSH